MLDRLADQLDPLGAADANAAAAAAAQASPASGDAADRTAAALAASADMNRVRAVIDALPEAVFLTESDGELRLTNPAADRLFAGQPIHDRDDLLSRFEEVVPERPNGHPTPSVDPRGPVTVRPRNQPNRWYALRTVTLDAPTDPFDGDGSAGSGGGPERAAVPAPSDPTGRGDSTSQTVFVLRDVTDSRDLRPVREAFLEVLSHELRTPITTIYAGSSVLARRPMLSPPATQILARDISAEAARLYDLVEDLLVLARLERRVLDPHDEPVLIQRSVDATIRMISDRLGDAPVERRGDLDVPPVHGDATYVEQACRNLILGAIRFAGTDPGAALVVEIRTDPAAGEVTVAVLDSGPWLSPDELDRAFELPDSSGAGRLAGAGVGPFVCRHLVEAMGGRVWVRNRAEGGLEIGFGLRIDERG